MRILVICMVAFCLLTGQAGATRMYLGWCGGISQALLPGNRGAVIPQAEGEVKAAVPDIDQLALQTANSKGINYRWSLATGVDTSMTPDAIATALNGQADFFVVLREKFEPVVEGEIPAAHLAYEAGEDWEYIVKETDSKGNTRRDEHYTVPMNSHTAYVDVASFAYHYEPVTTEMYVYDSTGRLIFTDWNVYRWHNRSVDVQKGMEDCFGILKDYHTEQNWRKLSGDEKSDVENINVWKAPGFQFDKKNAITVAPAAVSAPAYGELAAVPTFVERNVWGYALENRITTTHQGKGKYRLEVDLTTYNADFYRHAPYISTWTTRETVEDRTVRHDKSYYDTYKIYRHIRHAEGRQGYVSYNVDCLGMVFRMYDVVTDKLAFSFSATTKGTYTKAGVARIMEKFFKKLQD